MCPIDSSPMQHVCRFAYCACGASCEATAIVRISLRAPSGLIPGVRACTYVKKSRQPQQLGRNAFSQTLDLTHIQLFVQLSVHHLYSVHDERLEAARALVELARLVKYAVERGFVCRCCPRCSLHLSGFLEM